ncbi:MAG: site-specific DNA-methyltransferase [Bacteroidales bacterium]|nr:site-specific DNA-methyltransferase [Candidatus Sodaliphilus fimicaballi]
MDNFWLVQGDCMTEIPRIVGPVDMIFADPPYFLSTGNGTVKIGNRYHSFDKGDWDRVRSKEEIYEFNYKWLSLCREKLKDSGTIWVCGTYHNIYEVANCMKDLGYKILNMIVWQKTDPPKTLTNQRFNFSAEYIIWARKCENVSHYFNYELMEAMNNGVHMPDVWKLPAPGTWEKTCGKHPTQKPLRLLYRIILSSTRKGETILDPFAGSCTTGIAANLLNRSFIGIEQDEKFIALANKRRIELENEDRANQLYERMSENPEEVQVLVNHVRSTLQPIMKEKGITYMRAGESKGSILVTPGFERMGYVLLHTNGENCHLYKLKNKGSFQIWTKETLEAHGFHPEHASYYMVLHFDNTKEIDFTKHPKLRQGINTYRSKIRPLSDFIGIK